MGAKHNTGLLEICNRACDQMGHRERDTRPFCTALLDVADNRVLIRGR